MTRPEALYNDVQPAVPITGARVRKLGAVVLLVLLGIAPAQSGIAARAEDGQATVKARKSADLWENPTFAEGQLDQTSGWCGDADRP